MIDAAGGGIQIATQLQFKNKKLKKDNAYLHDENLRLRRELSPGFLSRIASFGKGALGLAATAIPMLNSAYQLGLPPSTLIGALGPVGGAIARFTMSSMTNYLLAENEETTLAKIAADAAGIAKAAVAAVPDMAGKAMGAVDAAIRGAEEAKDPVV
jgi:hypothetical protein